jgi:hypothetical protein
VNVSKHKLYSKPGLVRKEKTYGALRENYDRTNFKRTLPLKVYSELTDLNGEINYLST